VAGLRGSGAQGVRGSAIKGNINRVVGTTSANQRCRRGGGQREGVGCRGEIEVWKVNTMTIIKRPSQQRWENTGTRGPRGIRAAPLIHHHLLSDYCCLKFPFEITRNECEGAIIRKEIIVDQVIILGI